MKTKMLALFAVLVLSVALAGTAYAAWTAQIQINGEVKTGTMGVEISAANAVSTPTGFITVTQPAGTTSVYISIGPNAYPGVTGSVDITITNTGTVPVKITGEDDSVNTLSGAPAVGITVGQTGQLPDPNTVIPVGGHRTFTATYTVTENALQGETYEYYVTLDFGVA